MLSVMLAECVGREFTEYPAIVRGVLARFLSRRLAVEII
jgi:hypothetical protein